MSAQIDLVAADQPDHWPACATPDCDKKACLWAGTGLCTPCSQQRLGVDEVQRRYRATRVDYPNDRRWNGKVATAEGGGA